jgi:hypothetical protein
MRATLCLNCDRCCNPHQSAAANFIARRAEGLIVKLYFPPTQQVTATAPSVQHFGPLLAFNHCGDAKTKRSPHRRFEAR